MFDNKFTNIYNIYDGWIVTCLYRGIMEFKHISVLKEEAISGLNIKPDGVYVDCTLGGGGHSFEIASKLKNGKLICFDKDLDALEYAKEKLASFKDKIIFLHENFANIKSKLFELGIKKVDGILADLGVSSYQLDNIDRGFSYRGDSKLDMRMDKSKSLSAYEVINDYSEKDLQRILFNYGEEKNTFQIVSKIIKQRAIKDIVVSSYPPKLRNKPALANKVFQAIRIEVNGELEDLKCIDDMIELLNPEGRLCIITFHPLEDRIVKNTFKLHATDCLCPSNMPICVCKHKSDVELITRKPIVPSENEMLSNPRSASAKLRILKKK